MLKVIFPKDHNAKMEPSNIPLSQECVLHEHIKDQNYQISKVGILD